MAKYHKYYGTDGADQLLSDPDKGTNDAMFGYGGDDYIRGEGRS